MTRLQAVVDSANGFDAPLVVMDTAPAAVLGATLDPNVAARDRVMVANVGNFHTLAFRLGPSGSEGVFEHHTGLLDLPKLENLLQSLALAGRRFEDTADLRSATCQGADYWNDHRHPFVWRKSYNSN